MPHDDPPPILDRPPRYTDRPLPPYRFLPGLRDPERPHPVEDPAGYLHGLENAVEPLLPPQSWPDQTSYLLGVDLYNLAYWWEAHEAWEALWHQARRDTDDPVRAAQQHFLRGLIQLAGALLKRHVGRPRGADKLADRARANLALVQPRHGDRFMGLDLPSLLDRIDRRFEDPDAPPPALHPGPRR